LSPADQHTHTHYTQALSTTFFYLFCSINVGHCELLPNYYITCRVRDDAVSSVVRTLLFIIIMTVDQLLSVVLTRNTPSRKRALIAVATSLLHESYFSCAQIATLFYTPAVGTCQVLVFCFAGVNRQKLYYFLYILLCEHHRVTLYYINILYFTTFCDR